MFVDLKQGDCLELMCDVPDKSVDLVLCDLPYGMTDCKWDSIIPFEPLWKHYNRIVKENGAIALFGSEPFSTAVRASNKRKYKYDWYWIKNAPTGFCFAKYQPMRVVEQISIFQNKKTIRYYPQGLKRVENQKKRKGKKSNDGIYKNGLYGKEYYTEYTNYPRNALFVKAQREGIHPTQKPTELLEYLIKTYTIEGETVLDNCMGSGSTGVACVNTNRNFIGIELDENYFNIAVKRINEANNIKNCKHQITSE